MKEQHPDMPINIDRQSRVTFGGSRKNNFFALPTIDSLD